MGPACAEEAKAKNIAATPRIPWSKKWQPTPILLPGKFHGQRSLASYSHWGGKESDTTERAHTHTHTHRIPWPLQKSPVKPFLNLT